MNNKTKIVLNGFFNLEPKEQKDLIDVINSWLEKDYSKIERRQRILNESVRKVISGPIGEPCPCCGK